MPLQQRNDDEITAAGDMVGTFRWGKGKLLPLPDKAEVRKNETQKSATATPLHGWSQYLVHRAGKDFIALAQADRSIIDGMSYVCSLLLVLRKLGLEAHLRDIMKKHAKAEAAIEAEAGGKRQEMPLVTLVLLGASHHCEQRLLVDSTYWDELGLEYPGCDIKFWFVGPEIDVNLVRVQAQDEQGSAKAEKLSGKGKASKKSNNKSKKKKNKRKKKNTDKKEGEEMQISANVRAQCFCGTGGDFVKEHPETLERGWKTKESGGPTRRWSQTVFVAFNPGFGSGNGELMFSWAQDLRLLCAKGALLICTCANDYSDLRGETTLLNAFIGARYVVVPQRCPFQAASCMLDESNQNMWTSANSWYYAVQGIADGKQYDDGDLDKSKVFALAESLRMTEGHASQFSLGPGAPLRTADLDRIIKIATNTCGTAEFVGWDGEVEASVASFFSASAAAASDSGPKSKNKDGNKKAKKKTVKEMQEKNEGNSTGATTKEKTDEAAIVDYFPSTDFNELD